MDARAGKSGPCGWFLFQKFRVSSTRRTTADAAPFGTNTLTSDGRSLVIAIDEDSFRTGREQALRESVDGLIATAQPRAIASWS